MNTTESTGILAASDIDKMFESMYLDARSAPDYFYIHIENARRIRHYYRLGQVYRAHPLPRRKLRKCQLSHRMAVLRKAKAHIRRVEQAEVKREEEQMRNGNVKTVIWGQKS